MNEVFLVRIFAYSLFPLLLATAHIWLDKNAHSTARRIEIFLVYLFAISVGANGLGGAFGHLFLSDMVAESVGWSTGSPFQLEMGFANLMLGILGFIAVSQRDGFRTATIIATTVIGVGATGVHLVEILSHGNLSPGNTIQNIGNLLDPILLIALSVWLSRLNDQDVNSIDFLRWQSHIQPIAGLAAAGVGIGFGIGFSIDHLLLSTLIGGLSGAGMGIWMSYGHDRIQNAVTT